eukprot:TRINITY_DN3865_c0_g1_i1.p1 TRINITY_DN3865_c0_g1~~TRINITY_DN3865_c0_g1_i1.p1  ORF type:complete len:525 (-),score=82.90 TRINITY_DN3865_c0_g1_i1:326-1732(-)
MFAWKMERKADAIELIESVLLSVTVGDTVFFLQSLGIFSGMAVQWPQAFRDIIAPLKLLLFDVSILRVPCVFPQSLASAYISRLSLPILLLVVASVWYVLSIPLCKITKGRFPKLSKATSFNNVGMILQALFISLVKSVVSLVTCYGGSINGKTSARAYPWVVCGDSEHLAMIPVFVLGSVFTLALVAALVYMIYIAPRAYVKRDFKIASRFVVFKFHTRAYWFGVVILIRSLCLGLVEVVEPNNAYMQVILMQITLGASLILHLIHLPYADEYGNKLEAIELSLMLLMLAVGNYFNDSRDMSDGFSILMRNLLIALFVVAIVSVAFTGMYAAYLMRRPQLVERRRSKLVELKFDKLVSISHVILAKEAKEVEQVLGHASYIDRWHLAEVINFLSLELLGIKSNSIRDSRLPLVAVEVNDGGIDDLKSHAVKLSTQSSDGSLRNSFAKRVSSTTSLGEDAGQSDCVDI